MALRVLLAVSCLQAPFARVAVEGKLEDGAGVDGGALARSPGVRVGSRGCGRTGVC